jgi:hypothetical protein
MAVEQESKDIQTRKGRFSKFIGRIHPELSEAEIEWRSKVYEELESQEIVADPFLDPDYHRLTAFRRIPGVVIEKRA